MGHDPFGRLFGDGGDQVVVLVLIDHDEAVPLCGGGNEQVRKNLTPRS
ncbi:hypothetical protein BH24ACT2_BH24ACT2_08610 [soil metagenome]|jgi:hypothetical protein